MTTCAVIPVKDIKNAKSRLSRVLAPDERMQLFRAMVTDLLGTLTRCRWVDEMMVVTSDATASALCSDLGARILPEPRNPGMIAAVTGAAARLADDSVQRMIFLPGDVPLVTVEELEVVLMPVAEDASAGAEMVIVPASDLGGSNCIVASPPDCMPFGFGEGSFRRHLRLAREAGVSARVVKLPGIGLDVDTPHDLGVLIHLLETQSIECGTHNYLNDSGIIDRFFRGAFGSDTPQEEQKVGG